MTMNKLPIQLTKKEQLGGWIYWVIQNFILSAVLGFLALFFSSRVPLPVFDFLYLAINFTVLTVVMGRFLKESFLFGVKRPGFVLQSAFLAYMVYWLMTLAVSWLTYWLMPDFINLNDSSISDMIQQQSVLTLIGTVLLAPVAEELVYRGLIFGCLYDRKPWLGYLVSTVVFSLVHVIGYIGMYDPLALLIAFIQYLPAGICLGWAYARSQTIWAPIILHIAINQIATMSMR